MNHRPDALSSQSRVLLQCLLIIIGIAAAFWILHKLASVVLVLILAASFAYVIAPLVELAERPIRIGNRSRRLSRTVAIALVYVVMAGSVAGGAALLLPSATEQVGDMIVRAPAYAQSFITWKHGWSRYYARLRIPIELRESIDQSVLATGQAALESARSSAMVVAGTLSNLPWVALVPVLAFFLLKDAGRFRRSLLIALPYRIRLRSHRLFDDVNAALAAYVRAQLLACLLVGTLCGAGFAVLGVPYPVLLGVLAGALEFIPLVGPLLLAIVASIVSALHAPMLALSAIAFLTILRVLEDYVIYPRLIRRGIELHPLAIIVGVLCGAELDGVAGVFLAVPVVAIASVVLRHWFLWRVSDAAAQPEGSENASVSTRHALVAPSRVP